MLFTYSARIVSVLALVLGVLQLVLVFALADEPDGWADYLGRASPAAVFERGIYAILLSIALGTLSEISLSLRRRLNGESVPTDRA
ncbi:hypothetical protein EN817_22430 [Mesorhizobium sp. M3A.F.Ca.ET.174.01.1.1]|uniref:hypothetical protein n=1 Tax=unclassified Mesorhizobium TaxID=325217 RepID=UPI00109353D1|nr:MULTISPECIES: hypothetical protein [unclassified Mesorhizobium]TGS84867.1 hypothetical protein EN818_22640 [Mesorhizobium sp. M3A.F.Ca.ET.175.01.1.1]TGT23271.1 hypothetical protein EN817_22430 [Mesorhizobium sp. M3A.F.Ca.ET.174.01.1.1]